MARAIIHVDMDAFYASVEIRDDPALAGLPVVVGGSPAGRGVVAAASYVARRYGVHSAMPARTAARLCPGIVFIKPRHDYYARVSEQIHAILQTYTPQIESIALDEAFLDVSASLSLFGSPVTIGREIKQRIRDELGLVASIGLAPSKFVAKLASDLRKPDGFVAVAEADVESFLDPLPVSRIWGVGKTGERALSALGIRSISQVRQLSNDTLRNQFGEWGTHIWRLANGIDDRPVVPDRDAKSISHETTFFEDVSAMEVLRATLRELLEQVARRLRRQHRRARTVQLKLRFADFTTITRSRTLAQATDITRDIADVGDRLLDQALGTRPQPVRLIGIGVTELTDADTEQFDLFAEPARRRQRQIDTVVDRINERFGRGSAHRGGRVKID